MSNRNNDVYSVLPVSNCTLLSVGKTVDQLAVGQLGCFDAATNLSITSIDGVKNFYFAVGDVNGDSRMSAGQDIQKANMGAVTQKAYNSGSPMIVNIAGFKAECDTEYGIRVEFRNSRIQRIIGYNQFSKAYMVKTACCDDCAEGCGTGNIIELAELFMNAINSDDAGLMTAKLIAGATTTVNPHGVAVTQGDVLTQNQISTLKAYNKANPDTQVPVTLSLTSVPVKIGAFCQVNLGYHKLLETTLIVSLVEGFGCSGATVTNTYPIYSQGSGANVMQKEYHASGWQGSGPYKLSETTGTAKGNIKYLAKADKNYDQVILHYTTKSEGGWLEYEDTLSTVFAFETGPCEAKTALLTLLGA